MRRVYPGRRETERLVLMPPAAGDAALVAGALRMSLTQWLRWTAAVPEGLVLEMAEVAAEAEASNREGTSFTWRVVRKAGGELVGGVDLHSIDWTVPRCEVGFWGVPEWLGAGYLSEAVAAVVAMALGELGMRRVEARCDARNGRAQQLAERVGMQREGRLRSYGRDGSGAVCDVVVFARVI